MNNLNVELFPHITEEVVSDITGFKLCSYLVALEGWRRGLTLTWYKDETTLCKLDRLKSSTQGKFFSLSSNNKNHFFFRSRGDKVSNKSVRICQDKEKTKNILHQKDVPIPLGKVFETNDKDIFTYAENIGFPVVVKPLRGSMGKGVHTNIKSIDELDDVLTELKSAYNYSEYIVEKHYPGQEYRIYVVGDKVIGATNRVPANIVGDGKNTVKTLIENKNNDRKKNPYLAPKPIKLDYEVLNSLKNYGYDIEGIPKLGERINLREKSNLSSGGDPIEATDELSEEIKQLAVDALKALPSIPHAGVDVIVDPVSSNRGVVLEVNATAEIGFHLFPLEGKARDVPAAIIDYYFPETIKKEKSNFFFDYNSILEPLKTWSADEVRVSSPPNDEIYGRKYIVTGQVEKVGYMNRIRREALKMKLHGFVKKIGENKMEVTVLCKDESEAEKFLDVCYKGSKKSKVNNVESLILESPKDSPFKLGFEIII
ncbi:acylphosphatase [Virgibacillus sp. C22-A2]|uniref:Acylphosphatase n=1 Tax=Virgibacillus tibetensis TaxID=3042313 RepID=A0ABU6KMW0_9BACI|nr:acylphosphatase [Virgibacillus sp. C22-A2]